MAPLPTGINVPEGYTLHTENSTHLLIPSSTDAFLNPVQEFNRDLSVACIRMWSESFNEEKQNQWVSRNKRRADKGQASSLLNKRQKLGHLPNNASTLQTPNGTETATSTESPVESQMITDQEHISPSPNTYKFTMMEPLSATGLRSIRFAKEVPLLRYVVANDISPSAVEAIKRNVALNEVAEGSYPKLPEGLPSAPSSAETVSGEQNGQGEVRVRMGDARALLYSHIHESSRVDCIDLDPYGTVAPFVDGAVQAVSEGGLLCVTCTDLAILATNNYPEKCFANYGGVPIKGEYCHEFALRLVLHLLSTTAARYGRTILPLMSLSIDFYVRVFVRIRTAAIEVKKAFSLTSMVYVCSFCQSPTIQRLGRVVEKATRDGGQNLLYRSTAGPTCTSTCEECNSVMHIAGPIWTGQLHDKAFVSRLLDHVEKADNQYGTAARMKGMISVVKDELETPFYFTPSTVASFFNCQSPPLQDVVSALTNAGHEVSRSHACAGSLKTSATRQDIYDVFRTWIKTHPVTMKNVSKDSPKLNMLSKPARTDADFTHRGAGSLDSTGGNFVRYQQNPTPNWGPGRKAKRKQPSD